MKITTRYLIFIHFHDIVDDHMPYDELLDAFEELFVESKKIIFKNNVLKKQLASLMIEFKIF